MKPFLSLLSLLVLVQVAEAGPLRNRRATQGTCTSATCPVSAGSPTTGPSCSGPSCPTQPPQSFSTTTPNQPAAFGTALDQVNSQRAARGLRPFLHDPLLSAAAERAATFRANYRHPNGAVGLFGHTQSDFAFLQGASATAAGCAAYPAGYGFMACCTYENYTFAGAYSAPGADGKMYHHIFVR